MTYDKRFYIIDRTGIKRYASQSVGKFTIGKHRSEPPADLTRFVSAIIKERKAGRFESACGMKGTLVYSRNSKSAVGYVLDPAIAAQVGIPSSGSI